MGKIVYNGREYLSAGTASTMQGATSTTDGVSGLVPQPLIADRDKVLKGDGTWGTANKVTANPQDTPTDELTSIDIDGTVYEIIGGSAEIGKGPFIDTSNIIARYNASTYTSGTEITATEDIFVSFYITPGYATGGYFYINGVGVLQNWYEANSTRGYGYYVQKGQVFKIIYTPYDNDASRFGMIIYGLLDQGNGKDYYNPIIYSTEEREVGVWTDNKPLYQKTIVQNNLNWGNVNGVNSSIAHGVSNLDKCVGLKMSCPYLGVASGDIINNGNTGLPLASFRVNATNVYCVGGNGFYSGSADRFWFITILYTKTTDTAGSGSYNTLGVPTVHYSTDEQVIGTWIDGKPLYQKTIQASNKTCNSAGFVIDTGLTNVKKIIDEKITVYINQYSEEYLLPYLRENTSEEIILIGYVGSNGVPYLQVRTRGANYGTCSADVTLQYTKTTD